MRRRGLVRQPRQPGALARDVTRIALVKIASLIPPQGDRDASTTAQGRKGHGQSEQHASDVLWSGAPGTRGVRPIHWRDQLSRLVRSTIVASQMFAHPSQWDATLLVQRYVHVCLAVPLLVHDGLLGARPTRCGCRSRWQEHQPRRCPRRRLRLRSLPLFVEWLEGAGALGSWRHRARERALGGSLMQNRGPSLIDRRCNWNRPACLNSILGLNE